jgi:hypothetical protein
MAPNGEGEQLAYTGNLFVVHGGDGSCIGIVAAGAGSADVVVASEGLVDAASAARRIPVLRRAFEAAYPARALGGFAARVAVDAVSRSDGVKALQVVERRLAECRARMSAQRAALDRLGVRVDWKLGRPKPVHYNPASRSVEITDLAMAVDWMEKGQPQMLCHELAHGVYDVALHGADPGTRAAWAAALASGIYARVDDGSGHLARAYALTDEQEYFAEATEAWIGWNNRFPHTREQLETFDPRAAELMLRIWGAPPPGR